MSAANHSHYHPQHHQESDQHAAGDSAHGHEPAHDHSHERRGGLSGVLARLFGPHSHNAADSIDDALVGSAEGIRAVKISLLGLGATALLQLVVVLASGSVALL